MRTCVLAKTKHNMHKNRNIIFYAFLKLFTIQHLYLVAATSTVLCLSSYFCPNFTKIVSGCPTLLVQPWYDFCLITKKCIFSERIHFWLDLVSITISFIQFLLNSPPTLSATHKISCPTICRQSHDCWAMKK